MDPVKNTYDPTFIYHDPEQSVNQLTETVSSLVQANIIHNTNSESVTVYPVSCVQMAHLPWGNNMTHCL